MIRLTRDQLEPCYCEGRRVEFNVVRQAIREFGFVVLPNYFDAETTNALRLETINVLNGEVGRKQHFGDSLVQFSSGSEFEEIGSVPTIIRCAMDPLFNAIVKDFFDPFKADWLGATMHHDRNKSVYNHHWHWDPGIAIKAFTYLTDVTVGKGALNLSPVSQHDAYYRKLYFVPKGRKAYLTFIPESEISLGHAIEGSAGTVTIFNTNCFHMAGRIDPGKERIVIRFTYGPDRRIHEEARYGHVEQCFNPWYQSQAYEKPTTGNPDAPSPKPD